MGSKLSGLRTAKRKSGMASGDPTSASSKSAASTVFCVGDRVALVGLKKIEFNQHVGRIVTALGESGRHGVCLRGESPEATNDNPPIALKPENLRYVPCNMSGEPVGVVGSVGPKTVLMLLGECGWCLPDNVAKNVSGFLSIDRVSVDNVSVSGCSSTRGDFPLEAVLNNARDEWWISGAGSMPDGCGCEYLEFSLGPKPQRVEFVALRIPPMPYGPLSVRSFLVKAWSYSSGQWESASPELQTLDCADMQEFNLIPPVDTTGIRIECVRNAAAGSGVSFSDCIGLFQVSFS